MVRLGFSQKCGAMACVSTPKLWGGGGGGGGLEDCSSHQENLSEEQVSAPSLQTFKKLL